MIKMLNADCMEFMRGLPDKAFDLAIVDPPYGIDVMNGGGQPAKHGFRQWDRKDWDKVAPGSEYFIELRRVSVNQIVWGGNYFTEHLPASMGWVFWFKQKGMTFADGEMAWTSFDRATRVYDEDGMGGNGRIHPTQKPVALYKWLLTKYAKPGQTILDTHGGSGSIAIACHDLGFDLTWMELDADYYKAAVKRYETHASQLALFEPEKIAPKPMELGLT